MKTYMYKLTLVERLFEDDAWTEEDNKWVNDHFLRLKKDYELGKVIHVGRTEDPKGEGFGLVIFMAENNEDALRYMQEDPAVKHGQMTAMVMPYKVVFN